MCFRSCAFGQEKWTTGHTKRFEDLVLRKTPSGAKELCKNCINKDGMGKPARDGAIPRDSTIKALSNLVFHGMSCGQSSNMELESGPTIGDHLNYREFSHLLGISHVIEEDRND